MANVDIDSKLTGGMQGGLNSLITGFEKNDKGQQTQAFTFLEQFVGADVMKTLKEQLLSPEFAEHILGAFGLDGPNERNITGETKETQAPNVREQGHEAAKELAAQGVV